MSDGRANNTASRDPWIVFPGNLQGRSVRQTGARARCASPSRWLHRRCHSIGARRCVLAHLTVDVAGAADEAEMIARIAAELASAHALSEGRPLAVRVALVGT